MLTFYFILIEIYSKRFNFLPRSFTAIAVYKSLEDWEGANDRYREDRMSRYEQIESVMPGSGHYILLNEQ